MAVAMLVAGCSGGSGSEPATGTDAAEDAGDFVLTVEAAKPEDARVADVLRTSGVVREAVDGLNQQYALPEDIDIVLATENPDELGAHFDPESNAIVIPYSSLTADRELLKTHGYDTDEAADDAVLGDVLFTLYHELGHALIANYELPVTGKEEDAVDGLSAVLLSETYEDGQAIVVTAADWFSALAEERDGDHDFADYADTHSLDEQRFVTLLCLAYGSSPESYADLVGEDLVPEDRAQGCEDEYAQARDSWTALLEPWEKTT